LEQFTGVDRLLPSRTGVTSVSRLKNFAFAHLGQYDNLHAGVLILKQAFGLHRFLFGNETARDVKSVTAGMTAAGSASLRSTRST
jgi:hypothetical protein